MPAFVFFRRLRSIFLSPRRELPTTVADPGDLRATLPAVVALAALPALARFLSAGLIGVYHPRWRLGDLILPSGWMRAPVHSLIESLLLVAVGAGAWAVLALALTRLAPRLGGLGDPDGGRKVALYTLLPLWLAGGSLVLDSVPYLEALIPVIAVAGLAYGVFIGAIAVPLHLGTPDSRAAGHLLTALAIAVGAAGVLLYVLTGALAAWR